MVSNPQQQKNQHPPLESTVHAKELRALERGFSPQPASKGCSGEAPLTCSNARLIFLVSLLPERLSSVLVRHYFSKVKEGNDTLNTHIFPSGHPNPTPSFCVNRFQLTDFLRLFLFLHSLYRPRLWRDVIDKNAVLIQNPNASLFSHHIYLCHVFTLVED